MNQVEEWLIDDIPSGAGIALDIGANVGSWTSYLAGRYGAAIGVEPDPSAARELLSAVAALPNAFPIFAAVSDDKSHFVTLSQYSNSVWTSFRNDRDDAGDKTGSFVACALTIDKIVAMAKLCFSGMRVQFVKIDVEGMEHEALMGASCLLRVDRPVMIIEIHEFLRPGSAALCKSLLESVGYNLEKRIHPWYTDDMPETKQHFWYIARPA